MNERDIWDQVGILTLVRDEQGGVDLPPLPGQGGEKGPLREVLKLFLAAPPEARSRYSLRLENGQSFQRAGHLGTAVASGLPGSVIPGSPGKYARR